MAIIKTWYGEIELRNGEVVHPNDLHSDISSAAIWLEREQFTSLDKRCRGRLRKMALELGLVPTEHDYVSLLRGVSIQRAKEQISAVFAQPDARISQLIGAIDDIDESTNLLSERLFEWDILEYEGSKSITLIGNDEAGVDSDRTLKKDFAESVERLSELRREIANSVEREIQAVAPNLFAIAGGLLGARLIARAGSLQILARMPASKIQVMGASKALFKHLQFGANPPKHGLIFQHPFVKGAPRSQRGKMARALAAKLAIAARLDFYSKKEHPELLAQLEKRATELRNP